MLTRLNHIPTTQPYLHWFAISAYKVKSESDISKLTMPVFSLSNLSSLYSSVPLPSQEIPMILRLKRLTNSHCIINNYLFPMKKKRKKRKKKKTKERKKRKRKKSDYLFNDCLPTGSQIKIVEVHHIITS